MRLMYVLVATALLFTSGIAIAGPPPGDPAFVVDLTAIPGGQMYFLKCSRDTTDLTNCGLVSLWQQTNTVPGLQTIQKPYGGVLRPADKLLLG